MYNKMVKLHDLTPRPPAENYYQLMDRTGGSAVAEFFGSFAGFTEPT
jgi:hypothetical protein